MTNVNDLIKKFLIKNKLRGCVIVRDEENYVHVSQFQTSDDEAVELLSYGIHECVSRTIANNQEMLEKISLN